MSSDPNLETDRDTLRRLYITKELVIRDWYSGQLAVVAYSIAAAYEKPVHEHEWIPLYHRLRRILQDTAKVTFFREYQATNSLYDTLALFDILERELLDVTTTVAGT